MSALQLQEDFDKQLRDVTQQLETVDKQLSGMKPENIATLEKNAKLAAVSHRHLLYCKLDNGIA